MKATRILLCLAALVVTAALAACGEDEDGDAAGAEEEIEVLIEETVGSNDPSACTEAATLAFLEQTELEKGELAIQSCRESAADPSDDPDSVEATEIEVDGDTATASIAFEGGSFDEQTLSVSLVDEGGWKLDRMEDLIAFDPRAFGEGFAANPPDTVTRERAQCLGRQFASADAEELETAILSGDPAELAPYFAACPG